jgi:hypothetical protein
LKAPTTKNSNYSHKKKIRPSHSSNSNALESLMVLNNAMRAISGGSALCLEDDESIVNYSMLKEMNFSGGTGTNNLPLCDNFDVKNAESAKLKRIIDAQINYITNKNITIDSNFINTINESLNKLAQCECQLSENLDNLSYLMKNACDGNLLNNDTDLSKQKELYNTSKKTYTNRKKNIIETCCNKIESMMEMLKKMENEKATKESGVDYKFTYSADKSRSREPMGVTPRHAKLKNLFDSNMPSGWIQ